MSSLKLMSTCVEYHLNGVIPKSRVLPAGRGISPAHTATFSLSHDLQLATGHCPLATANCPTHTAKPQSDPDSPPASLEPSHSPPPPPESSATKSAGCLPPPHASPSRYKTSAAPPIPTPHKTVQSPASRPPP